MKVRECVDEKVNEMRTDLARNLSLQPKKTIKIISLVDELESEGYISRYIEDGSLFYTFNASAILQNRLVVGESQHAFIDVTGFRGIGKTHELIGFAKKRDYAVICATQYLAELVRVKYVYQKVFGQSDNLRGVDGVFVADEGVDIQKLIDLGVNVITGYISR